MSGTQKWATISAVSAQRLPPAANAAMAAALARLLDEADRALSHDTDEARGLLARATAMLARPEAAPVRRGRLAPWQERRVITHMEENLHEPMRVEHLAALVRLSASYFARAFKASFGATPHDYLLRLRVQRAQLHLLHSDVPLAQIALDCGMCDQAHFSRVFRRATGTSPSAWRRQNSAPGEYRGTV